MSIQEQQIQQFSQLNLVGGGSRQPDGAEKRKKQLVLVDLFTLSILTPQNWLF